MYASSLIFNKFDFLIHDVVMLIFLDTNFHIFYENHSFIDKEMLTFCGQWMNEIKMKYENKIRC